MTYADIINQALVDLGAIKPGATPSTTIRDDSFVRLNQMWEGWGADPTISNAQYHQNYFPSAGINQYTFGVGGTFSSPAYPVRVYGAVSTSGNFRSPVKVISYQQFDEQMLDPIGSSSVLAQSLACDNGYPLKLVRLFPVPAGGSTLTLDFWGEMTAFNAVGDTVSVAPAFSDALHFNLAMAMLPQYGRQGIDATAIAANAAKSLGVIQQLNRLILGANPTPQAAA
jgi:hypothetical protein